MEKDREQHQIDSAASAEISRREALEKIGRYGLYVPATLAVLAAAPRAFAQSPDSTTLRGTVYIQGNPMSGANVELNLPTPDSAASGQKPPDYTTTTNKSGQYEFNVPQAISGEVYIYAHAVMPTTALPECTGHIEPIVHPGLNTGLDITMICP